LNQNDIAGYYVSEKEQIPKILTIIDDLFGEFINRNIEIQILDNLCDLRDMIQKTVLNWSMCKMVSASSKKRNST
jgi:hypothetical protein